MKKATTLLFLLMICPVNAWPVIVSDSGIDHQEAKDLVYSIPEEYFEFVDIVYFRDQATTKRGYARVEWNKAHYCYYGHIWIYGVDFALLQHELGHIDEFCVQKSQTTSEQYADNFKILWHH